MFDGSTKKVTNSHHVEGGVSFLYRWWSL